MDPNFPELDEPLGWGGVGCNLTLASKQRAPAGFWDSDQVPFWSERERNGLRGSTSSFINGL